VLVLPDASVTVRITVLTPMFAQANVVLETLKVTGPQLSLLPLFTLAAVMLADAPTNVTVTDLQIAVGDVTS